MQRLSRINKLTMQQIQKIQPQDAYNSLLMKEVNKTAAVTGNEIPSSMIKIFQVSSLNQSHGANVDAYQYGKCWLDMSKGERVEKWVEVLKAFSMFFNTDNSTVANTPEATYQLAAVIITVKHPTVLPFEMMDFYKNKSSNKDFFEQKKKSFTSYTIPFFVSEVYDYYLGRLKLVSAAQDIEDMKERERTVKLSQHTEIDPFKFYATETNYDKVRITHAKSIAELDDYKEWYSKNKPALELSAAVEFLKGIDNVKLYSTNEILRRRRLLNENFFWEYSTSGNLISFSCSDTRKDLFFEYQTILQKYSTFKFIKK